MNKTRTTAEWQAADPSRPVQAALASAGSFAVGAALPLAVAWLAPAPVLMASSSARYT